MNMKLVATMLAMGALVTALPVAAADTASVAVLDHAVNDGSSDRANFAFDSAIHVNVRPIAIICTPVVSCAIGTGLAWCNWAVDTLVGGSCYP